MKELLFESPAKVWEEGLPIGNGKLGAMLFGAPEHLQIQCNEDSLWYGAYRNRNNPDAKEQLAKIRALIFNDEVDEAEKLIQLSMTGVPEYQRHYEPAGTIHLWNQQRGETKNYARQLDLTTACAKEQFQIGSTSYCSETFASFPDQVIVYSLIASEQKGTRLRIHLNRLRGLSTGFSKKITPDGKIGTLMISGKTGDDGVSYCHGLTVTTDGEITNFGEYLLVENYSHLNLFSALDTSYREKNPTKSVSQRLEKIVTDTLETLKGRHVADYQKIFNRMEFCLGEKSNHRMTVQHMLDQAKSNQDVPELVELLFHFGRYLLIASSRPGSLPANLQGVWNQDTTPAWDSKYTININTEMNYWPAEKGNLAECHLPLFDLLKKMYPNGQRTAKEMYGLDGFVAHHNTDLWGDTAPQDAYLPATYWTLGGAWLCLGIWEHYQYTLDLEFLKEYFPILQDAVRFLSGYGIESPNGEFVLCPSVSPENKFVNRSGKIGYMYYGNTMDTQMIWELFTSYAGACDLVAHDDELLTRAQEIMQRLPQYKIGKYGQLQEWYEDFEEVDPGHRHVSHLFGLFPGHHLKNADEKFIEAGKKTLVRRLANGGAHTGWSVAWLINIWANFGDGQESYQMIKKQLRQSILPNLLDNHPPFQIDGNFGLTSGIIEMLVQSEGNQVTLLPAIPKEWPHGEVKGIALPGKRTVSLIWKSSQLQTVQISGRHLKDILLSYQGNTWNLGDVKVSELPFVLLTEEIFLRKNK